MANILINKISYKNFKGISDFELNLSGQGATVFGRNASGKTSLADGFRWLLFGKNLSDEKLNPKPLNDDNEEQLGLDPEIEAELVIDGKVVILKRVQSEKWTTKNGALEKTRGSDTTKYFIDMVPTKEKEWKEFVSGIANESLFFILSNPGSFMRLAWKERRELLVKLSGMTDDDIIKSNPKLAEVSKILKDHSVEDMKKILAAQKKEIKQQIDGIPLQIQENQEAINRLKLDDSNPDELKEMIIAAVELVTKKEEQLLLAKQGDPALNYQEQISKLNLKMSNEKVEFLATGNLNTQNLQNEVIELQRTVTNLRSQESKVSSEIYQLELLIKNEQEELEKLRNKYSELKDLSFDEHQKECVTCGQELPESQLAEIIEKFNLKKANDLEENIAVGKAKNQEVKANQEKLRNLINEKTLLATELADKEKGLDLLNDELTFQQSKIGSFEDTDSHKKILKEIDELQQKVLTAKADSSQEIQVAQTAYDAAVKNKEKLQEQLQQFEQFKPFEARIGELRKKDKELKEQNQEVERQLFMIDEFVRLKVKMLEESINSKFKLVQFKLFDLQKNGGLNEVCEATYKGVGYSSSLNNGAKINCDIDIINTLSEFHNLHLPLFVDNAEAVNELIDSESQLIELRVSEDKKLKVEVNT
ncbi:AAA family ATPase [Enterococcus sp. LJL128]